MLSLYYYANELNETTRKEAGVLREWLKDARTKKNLSMAEMGRKLNISESYYSYIESGERQKNMDISLASKISVVLDIPLNEIVKAEA